MPFKLPSRGRRAPLFLATAAFTSAAAAAAYDEKAKMALHGVARSCRAIYTIGIVVVDYKYSLRGLDPEEKEYRIKLSEVHLRSARRLLKLCEANGGFYVKAGQFVSSLRQVPKEYSSTLSSLQDKATPYNIRDIKRVVEQNLGRDLSDIFLAFDEQPIAAASIAQVHRGLLKNNQEVAIKVQYPGLEQRMRIDIVTMAILTRSVSWMFPDYRFERILFEFERAMSMELDFIQEAKNSERAANNFKENKIVRFPNVFWDFTTNKVLTMEFCHGKKVDDVNFLRKSGIKPTKVAKALMEVFAEMIFVHGFVHGDPHPGNILVSPEGPGGFSLVLLDHGIYIELDEQFRLDYCNLWKALVLLDARRILELGEKFGVGRFAKYFPVMFTGRTIESKSVLGTQMSSEEKKRLKQELNSLKMDDISSFMESLPPDFLVILRTDGLLRSIVGKLGAPRHVRLLAYAKYAIYGLEKQSKSQSGVLDHVLLKLRMNVSYLQLRVILESAALLSQLNDLRRRITSKVKRMLHQVIHYLGRSLLLLYP